MLKLFIFISLSLSVYAFEAMPMKSGLSNASKVYFVSVAGDDNNKGRTHLQAFKTIQHALDLAQAGETIVILRGQYYEDLHSVRSGTAEKPIRITGFPESILKGKKKARMFEINHSYIELSNFSINGKVGKGDKMSDYRDKLVYIIGLKDIGVTGVKLLGMDLQNAYGECVRIKYLASKNEVGYSHIRNCGLRDFVFDRGQHNGEAIYIGTAPEQIVEGKNPSKVVDTSHENWIHDNVIEPFASECVDVKEGAHHNLIENNICLEQKDPNVGGISLRGNNNIVRHNIVFKNKGAGIRLGGDTQADGINNIVYANYVGDSEQGGLKIMSDPEKNTLCGNDLFMEKKQKKMRFGKKHKIMLMGCEDL